MSRRTILSKTINVKTVRIRTHSSFLEVLSAQLLGQFNVNVNGKVNVTLPKDMNYENLDLDTAVDMISKKKKKKKFFKRK